MSEEWTLNIASLWVVAPPVACTGTPDKRFLTNYGPVMRIQTTTGPGVPLFDDEDLGQRYVREGQFGDYQPATFENPHALLSFLSAMEQMKTSCFVVNPTFGKSHVRLYPLEKAVRDIHKVFSEGRPPDGDS
jgi:hypothetical protein